MDKPTMQVVLLDKVIVPSRMEGFTHKFNVGDVLNIVGEDEESYNVLSTPTDEFYNLHNNEEVDLYNIKFYKSSKNITYKLREFKEI